MGKRWIFFPWRELAFSTDWATIINPKLPDEDFTKAIQVAEAEFDHHHPDVVVGSPTPAFRPFCLLIAHLAIWIDADISQWLNSEKM